MQLTPEYELSSRLRRFQTEMQAQQLDAVVVAQSADLFYFTGTIQSGFLYVPSEGPAIYLVRRDLARAKRESRLERIVPFGSLRDVAGILRSFGCVPPRRIGFEFDVLPVALFNRYRELFAPAECLDASLALRRVRMIKSPYEIELIRKAGAQADRVFCHARSLLRPRMSDIAFAAELESLMRHEGHPGLIRMRSFNGEMMFAHIFSGPDSAVPAHLDTPLGGVGPHPSFGQGASLRQIQPHEPVIVDTGSFHGGYLADQTRVLCIGELPERLHRAYDDMLQIQRLMQRIVAPGVTWARVYNECLERAQALGYADHFMGMKGAQAKFIGHGLGIEIDEFPIFSSAFTEDVLAENMVFAFEPKAVFPEQGAVGIENTYVVNAMGPETLTVSDEALAVVALPP